MESFPDNILTSSLKPLSSVPNPIHVHIPVSDGSDVRCHYYYCVAEIDVWLSLSVNSALIHNLKQDIENILMCLFNRQTHRVGLTAHSVSCRPPRILHIPEALRPDGYSKLLHEFTVSADKGILSTEHLPASCLEAESYPHPLVPGRNEL